MYLRVTCKQCDQSFKIHERYAGRRGSCPKCKSTFRVPMITAEDIQETKEEIPAPGTNTTTPPVPEWMKEKQKREQQRHEPVVLAPIPAQKPKPKPTASPALPVAKLARVPRNKKVEPARSSQSSRKQRKRNPQPEPKPSLVVAESSRWTLKRGLLLGGGLLGACLLLVILWQSGSDQPGELLAEVASPENTLAAARKAAVDHDREYQKSIKPFLKKHCIDCHGEGNDELDFDRFPDFASVEKQRPTWKKVLTMLQTGAMPPKDHDSLPSDAERQQIVSWLDQNLFHVDCELVHDPGRVTIRRLNRAEYNNTIRDLIGVDFKPADDFPSDDVGEGFDNNGDVLSLPPLLLEKYLNAAEKITAAAILTDNLSGKTTQLRQDRELRTGGSATQGGDGFVHINSAGEVTASFEFPGTGTYEIIVHASADQAGSELAKMAVKLNGRTIKTVEVTGNRQAKDYKLTAKVSKGKGNLTVAFINDYYNPKARDRSQRDRNLRVKSIELKGPLDGPPPTLPDTHTRILLAKPEKGQSVKQAAQKIFKAFCFRAYRRPVTEADIDPLVRLVDFVVNEGETFERAVEIGVQAVLVSPHFLFRLENDDQPDDPNQMRTLNDFELATRISYFLWSSMPDDQLLDLARKGELHNPKVLERQIQRMLVDPKSKALIENFATQWLNLRNLDELTPNPQQFRTFTPELKKDMQTETTMLFETIMRDNRSIQDFLTADYSFLNERLADHYGISGVKGTAFRQVSLKGGQRKGVLTHASILTLTSNPTRTSPVKRGKWILENILDSAPPDPPANVPDLEETAKANPGLSLIESLALHRENATCASCHLTMDPIGLSFENYDAVGRWRTMDGKFPVNPAGVLPSGEEFDGPMELIGVLSGREEEFAKAISRKLLIYALGRGLALYDQCAVDEIADNLKEDNYRFHRLVLEVVRSQPFLKRRGDGGSQ